MNYRADERFIRLKNMLLSDRLLELYVERDEARKERDWRRAHELQGAIDAVSREHREVIKATK